LLVIAIFALLPASVVSQRKSKGVASFKNVMWSPPNVAARDLYNGPGGVAMRPATTRVQLIKRETGGNNLKYRIRDSRGRIWVAKIADESQPEVAANRLLWAVGYRTEIDYLVPQLTIPGKKTYRNVRLEARPSNVIRGDRWEWEQNPFSGSKEFQGLKVLMALINNWDLKNDNNAILQVAGERRYIVSDLGSSFGKLPIGSALILNRIGRSANDPADYVNSTFIHGLEEDRTIDFGYKGKAKELLKGITLEQAQWVSELLSQITDKQLRDAFRAANYSRSEIDLLAGGVRRRIIELRNISARFEAVR